MARPYLHDKNWFLARIEPEPMSGCWLWTGALNCYGYGYVRVKNADGSHRNTGAHRGVYELWVGAIPKGLQLDHICRVRCCVNPRHLRVVTNRENGLAPGSLSVAKLNSLKTACVHGHEYTAENTLHWKRWRRETTRRCCATCASERHARARAKRREKKEL